MVAVVALVQWFTAQPLVSDVALLVALFTVSSERPWGTAAAAWAVLELGVVMASVRWDLAGSWIRSLVALCGLAAAALLLGVALRTRRARLAELTERAERLELERDQQAQIAVAAERTRIAREMHDVIAHSLTVIISMADGAAAKLEREPDRAGAAIKAVADVGRQALGELAVYRIVQEAATNTLKHAPGARSLRIRLSFDRPRLRIEVLDDGPSSAAPAAPLSGGHGIHGMRERVALYGGHVDAGPAAAGGWAVRATLTVQPATP